MHEGPDNPPRPPPLRSLGSPPRSRRGGDGPLEAGGCVGTGVGGGGGGGRGGCMGRGAGGERAQMRRSWSARGEKSPKLLIPDRWRPGVCPRRAGGSSEPAGVAPLPPPPHGGHAGSARGGWGGVGGANGA